MTLLFTPRGQQAIASARKEASRLGQKSVEAEHLLLGLLGLDAGVGLHVITRSGVDVGLVRRRVEEQIASAVPASAGKPPFSARFKKVLAQASRESKAMGHSYIGTDHLLLGLMREGKGVAFAVLKEFGFDLEKTRQEVLLGLGNRGGPIDDMSKKLDAVLDLLGRLKLEVDELRRAASKETV